MAVSYVDCFCDFPSLVLSDCEGQLLCHSFHQLLSLLYLHLPAVQQARWEAQGVVSRQRPLEEMGPRWGAIMEGVKSLPLVGGINADVIGHLVELTYK